MKSVEQEHSMIQDGIIDKSRELGTKGHASATQTDTDADVHLVSDAPNVGWMLAGACMNFRLLERER